MNRWLALLLAIVCGAVGALALMMAGTATLMGFLWIFVFGDDTWPAWVEQVLNIALPIVGLALWSVLAWAIWERLKAPPQAD